MSNYRTVEWKRVDIYNAAVSTQLNLEYICFKSIYFAGGWGPSVVQSCCRSRCVSDTRGCGNFNNKLIIYWFHFKLRGDLFFIVSSHPQTAQFLFFFNVVHFYSHLFLIIYLWLEILQIFHFLWWKNIEQSTKYIFAGIYQNMRFKLMLNLLLFNVNE